MRNAQRRGRSKRTTIIVGVLLILAAVSLVAVVTNPAIHWRIEVVLLKASGELASIEWTWLIKALRPGSSIYLEDIAKTANPYSAIINPHVSTDDLRAGSDLYRTKCAICHSNNAHGSATSLFDRDFSHGDSDWAIFVSIRDGIASTAMRPQELDEDQIWQVVTYLRGQEDSMPDDVSPAQFAFRSVRPVSFEGLVDGSLYPENWSTYSGTVDGARFSRLDGLTTENVNGLKLAWVFQGRAHDYHLEATPIVFDGILLTTEPPGSVLALGAESGRVLWRFSRPVPSDIRICCGTVNRGVAVGNSLVFFGTLDAHLVALDIRSGAVVWDIETAEHSDGYSSTAAPLVVNNLVIVGVAGGEFGIRGFIDAYDIDTGARVWRFNTIPAPGDPGNESWPGDSWRTGGGPTWMTGSYHADTNLVYWAVGNPGPDFSGKTRIGDNLFTNSIVALDADSGKRVWSFQFTPGDVHDFDANHVPIVSELSIDGRLRTVVMSATKNGFFYILDAKTGEFISALEITYQNWALGLDQYGRPIRNEAATPSPRGTRAYPSAAGGANWWPASFNPDLRIFTVPVLEGGAIYYSSDDDFQRGELYTGGSSGPIPGEPRYTSLKAISPEKNEIIWERRGSDDRDFALTGGALSTITGLLFWGDSRYFHALDAVNGKVLWQTNVGGHIVAAPITYSVNRKQYVAVSAGRGLFVFSL